MSARRLAATELAVALVLWLVFGGRVLMANDAAHPADVIVVIGGDHKPERAHMAADLYRQGLAPRVLVSAGSIVLEGTERLPEAQVLFRQLVEQGIPADHVSVEGQSQTTVQNAFYTREILRDQKVRSILLVTSPYTSGRARRIFEDMLGAEFAVTVQPARLTGLGWAGWWLEPDQIGVVLSEYWKWVVYGLARQ